MRKAKILLTIALSMFLLSTSIFMAQADEQRNDVLYYCNCGPKCKCNSVSTSPGDCKCGKPMKWGHVLKIEGNVAFVCGCGEGCSCDLDPKNPKKCGCGNPVKKINLKGTGVYFCNCGSGCKCNTLSNEPGKCKCGMDLKKAD